MNAKLKPATNLERLHERLGASAPDWLTELAKMCDQTSQGKVAKQLGYSPATVNQVLAGKYGAGHGGDLKRFEHTVRGALMGVTVDCPVLGEIGKDRCLQEQAKPFADTSSHRAQLFHACRSWCPNSNHGGQNDQ